MPAIYCNSNRKWKWGNKGECIYDTKTKAEEAGIAIQIQKINNARKNISKISKDYGKD